MVGVRIPKGRRWNVYKRRDNCGEEWECIRKTGKCI